jgi:hypothetical protein
MSDLVFWTWVAGGTPLALALIRRAVEWSLDAISAGTIARRPPPESDRRVIVGYGGRMGDGEMFDG